ncbi:MAG: tRNA uridine-5-carboxymethylaminomethyl(34) synthesis GTPase MnmE [Gammaproteobacteria bacterium]|nr:tRNA uridine-5-carboxymethylaminomethyl(34) synthesis GTPase MnmE [Gammaproteobacteria bacterium]
MTATDTIAAIATAAGNAALGIVRVSGPAVPHLLYSVIGAVPPPRVASYHTFRDHDGRHLDAGLVLYFPSPASFTGEAAGEFHCHGNDIVLQQLLQALCHFGARPARPGEFSERAFRNGKIDLAQAEAIADLIASRSARAARSALRTLRGEFSKHIDCLIADLTTTRVAFEGAIDFPDDIPGDILGATQHARINTLRNAIAELTRNARQGARLHAGASAAIIGAPNVGKSTLLNRLARAEKAIVSPVPGTTRDLIEVDTLLHDLPIRLFDTAGLRTSSEAIEQEGIRRAKQAMSTADVILLMTDVPTLLPPHELLAALGEHTPPATPIITVHNKIDSYSHLPMVVGVPAAPHVFISARDGTGTELLSSTLAGMLGLDAADENEFIARARHLAALSLAHLELEPIDLALAIAAPELAAEALRRAGLALATITGSATSEELLGEIFARFCIGK